MWEFVTFFKLPSAMEGAIRRLPWQKFLAQGLKYSKPQYRYLSASVGAGAARKARGGRAFSGDSNNDDKAETVKFSFVEAKNGDQIDVVAKVGKTVLETAIDNNVDIEGL